MTTAGGALAAMAAFPVATLDTFIAPGPILILAPHPDDESLGCGGLIASCCGAGQPPFVLVLTDGTGSHPNSRAYRPARLRRTREAETRAACAHLGLGPDRIGFLGLRDTEGPIAGPAFDAAVTAVAGLAFRLDAVTILATWAHDPHCDHESAHLIAAAAAVQASLRHLAYPVWGLALPPETTLPGPPPKGLRFDVSAQLARKRAAIAAHRSQYSDLIVDDPGGFRLQPGFLALFDRAFETYIEV